MRKLLAALAVPLSFGFASALHAQAWPSKPIRYICNFAPGGTMDIYYKDQELETAFAKRLGVPLLLANVTQQVYQMARTAGLNKEDGAAIIKVIERLAGVTVGAKRDGEG